MEYSCWFSVWQSWASHGLCHALSLFFNSQAEHSFVYGLCLLDTLRACQDIQAAISTKHVTSHDQDYAHFISEMQPRKLTFILEYSSTFLNLNNFISAALTQFSSTQESDPTPTSFFCKFEKRKGIISPVVKLRYSSRSTKFRAKPA